MARKVFITLALLALIAVATANVARRPLSEEEVELEEEQMSTVQVR